MRILVSVFGVAIAWIDCVFACRHLLWQQQVVIVLVPHGIRSHLNVLLWVAIWKSHMVEVVFVEMNDVFVDQTLRNGIICLISRMHMHHLSAWVLIHAMRLFFRPGTHVVVLLTAAVTSHTTILTSWGLMQLPLLCIVLIDLIVLELGLEVITRNWLLIRHIMSLMRVLFVLFSWL